MCVYVCVYVCVCVFSFVCLCVCVCVCACVRVISLACENLGGRVFHIHGKRLRSCQRIQFLK